jgi:hypothetical protein
MLDAMKGPVDRYEGVSRQCYYISRQCYYI